MADPVAIQDEIAVIEKRIEEAQTQLKDAKERLRKAQDASFVQPGANMSAEEKMALIKVNLAEVLNPEIMDEALKKQGHLKVYWGTATTGRPHCGYVCSHCHYTVACTTNTHGAVRTHPQACSISRCRLSRQDSPR
jgi:tyrosyl-tRNA synthetase